MKTQKSFLKNLGFVVDTEQTLLKVLYDNADVTIMAIIGFWIKGMLKDIKKIDVMASKLSSLNDTVKGFEGELKGLNMMIHENGKQNALTEQKVNAAFKHLDRINRKLEL